MPRWKLEDAKNQFSKLVQAARRQPQIVTRHGRDEVVVLSVQKYRQLAEPTTTLVDFLTKSPLAAALRANELDLRRSRELPRDVDL